MQQYIVALLNAQRERKKERERERESQLMQLIDNIDCERNSIDA